MAVLAERMFKLKAYDRFPGPHVNESALGKIYGKGLGGKKQLEI